MNGFQEAFGRHAQGTWAAPGRVNIIGEHTDYNDGWALPAAIAMECRVAAATRSDGLLRCFSRQHGPGQEISVGDLAPGAVSGWSSYVWGTAWALREAGVEITGADVYIDSDVPIGAGVSSSAALECAAGMAMADLAGGVDPTTLALAAQRAEAEMAGAPVGMMDQVASVFGKAGTAILLDCRTLDRTEIALPLSQNGLRLMVLDTRIAHAHATGGYAARRRSCERAAQVLGVPALRDATPEQVDAARAGLGPEGFRRARHVVTENERVLLLADGLAQGDVSGLGPVLAAGHASLRDDFEVSCPELDLTVDAAVSAGAAAARMTGGGFGGSAVAIVAEGLVEQVGRAVQDAAAAAGFPRTAVHVTEPSAGARRTG